MNELDVFQSNLAYLIISGILKLENTHVMGYSKEFIKEFLVYYKNLEKNPYNEYYYNENSGRTSMYDKKGRRRVILLYSPHSVWKNLMKKNPNYILVQEYRC